MQMREKKIPHSSCDDDDPDRGDQRPAASVDDFISILGELLGVVSAQRFLIQ